MVQKHKDELLCNRDTKITDYNINKGHTRKKIPVKLVLANECDKIFAYIVLSTCKLAGKALTSLYHNRFMIETYYRQMHRFQMFTCSQHPAVRYIIVLIAFWLHNFRAYFKSPLNSLKSSSRRCRVDFVYTANDFCEFLLTSWHWAIFQGCNAFSRR